MDYAQRFGELSPESRFFETKSNRPSSTVPVDPIFIAPSQIASHPLPDSQKPGNAIDASDSSEAEIEPSQCCDSDDAFRMLYFCSVCDILYCDDCWGRQLPHKRNLSRDAVKHEKGDRSLATVAKAMKGIFNAKYDKEKLEQLHMEDRRTRWFGISHLEDGSSKFETTGRFQDLLDPVQQSLGTAIFPSIVSFVGETGAGKSTLIKGLITAGNSHANDQKSKAAKRESTNAAVEDTLQLKPCEMPVAGSVYEGDVPSSGDVHLYVDPWSINTHIPILLVDCEGINGGNREPIAEATWRENLKRGNSDRHVKRIKNNLPLEVDRIFNSADKKERRTRQFAVEQVYPRILYAFSDTVVFVTQNAKTFESTVVQLIRWARSALEYSVNQPTLPSALIVLNMAESELSDDYWDPDNRTRSMLDSVNHLISKNAEMSDWVDKLNEGVPEENAITKVEELLRVYYHQVRITSIPAARNTGRPKLVHQQLQRAYNEIAKMSADAAKRKQSARMHLKYTDLILYLNSAFDHFSTCPDEPFNFVNSAFRQNPISEDFGGGILQLMISLLRYPKAPAAGYKEREIYEAIVDIVGGAILLDTTRNGKMGSPEDLFSHYKKHITHALDQFYSEYYPCSFEQKGKKCVNVRLRHSKGHQTARGKLFGPKNAEFLSNETVLQEPQKRKILFDNQLTVFFLSYWVYTNSLSNRNSDRNSTDEAPLAAKLHRELAIKPFFCSYTSLRSDHMCLMCLAEVTKYSLRCASAHAICEPCLKSFGTTKNMVYYDLLYCPLCGEKPNVPYSFTVTIPEVSPCILSLDGGGIRGIVQLEALRAIERTIALDVPVREFFDLIIGTSCGGLVGLGLGVKRMSVDQACGEFEAFCKEAFKPRTGMDTFLFGLIVQLFHKNSKYETSAIEKRLEEEFKMDRETRSEALFGFDKFICEGNRYCATAVLATAMDKIALVFGNYNRRSHKLDGLDGEKSAQYQLYHPQLTDEASRLKVWEAARATSAAPTYFTPFHHKPSGQILQDGALRYNNPVEVAFAEGQKLLPGPCSNSLPDLLLSIGTGHAIESREQAIALSRSKKLSRVAEGAKDMIKLAKNAVEDNLDTSKAWNAFISKHPSDTHRFVRLNMELGEKRPDLDDLSAIPYLQNTASTQFAIDRQIKRVADRLIASLFYFHLETVEASQGDQSYSHICRGSIRCRLSYKEMGASMLADKFRARLPDATFIIESAASPFSEAATNAKLEGRRPVERTTVVLRGTSAGVEVDQFGALCSAIDTRRVWQFPVSIPVLDCASSTNITLESEGHILGSISSFPRSLVVEWNESRQARGPLELHRRPTTAASSTESSSSSSSFVQVDKLKNHSCVTEASSDWKPPSVDRDPGLFKILGNGVFYLDNLELPPRTSEERPKSAPESNVRPRSAMGTTRASNMKSTTSYSLRMLIRTEVGSNPTDRARMMLENIRKMARSSHFTSESFTKKSSQWIESIESTRERISDAAIKAGRGKGGLGLPA
ncbi:hypothetical protein BJ508DRAFT_323445 [Ascobolus immersus RN42]|uniref:PNPLA domain-containing protein n=1 Tax=Ascobolus immersus RN42 TaxID=1160509 RepID=A0A3N4IK20_ASCIM|nr:hypothetical protein BJ508DRAFT_323445 [Ascobolus immersus RN42]